MKFLMLLISLSFWVWPVCLPAQDTGGETKDVNPVVELAKDGFPTGDDTPEGAACDLVRAFILSDVDLLKKICLPKYAGAEIGKRYDEFLKKIITGTEEDKVRKDPHPKGPKEIAKVFAARHLSRNGPGSYGFAVHNFDSVMFVDVGAILHDGSRFLNRTMVVQRKGKWFVHPCPTIDTLLSMGLNDEADSEIDFREKYTIPEKDGEE